MYARETKIYKIILLGEAGAGKTCLINQLVLGEFFHNYKATIGFSFLSKDLVLDEKAYTLQIWDTAGQERFRSLGSGYFRGSECCVLVYDITEPASFEALDGWRDQFLREASPDEPEKFPFVLVGAKLDLEAERKVSKKRAEDWVRTRGNIKYFETSAKDNTNVAEVFEMVARLADDYGGKQVAVMRSQQTNRGAQLARGSAQSKSCSC